MDNCTIEISSQTLKTMLSGDIDDSCKAIVAYASGLNLSEWFVKHHPKNVDSVRLCRLMIEADPVLAKSFKLMGRVSPEWGCVVDGWDELCSALDQVDNWQRSLWRDGAWQGQGARDVLLRLLKITGDEKPIAR